MGLKDYNPALTTRQSARHLEARPHDMTAIPHQATTAARTVRVHVVDDDPAILRVVAKFLGSAGVPSVCHSSAADFLQALEPDEFGCAVVDMVLPGVERFSLLQRLAQDFPGVQVIMMSGHGDIPNAVAAVRQGAMDFLEKPLVRQRLTGLVFGALEIAHERRARAVRGHNTRARIERLTPREIELLPMFCSGRSVKEIAFDLGLSHKTVQVHRSRILDRMQVDSVVELSNLLHEIEWTGNGGADASGRVLG
jgi:FixJ family two-component response regulator